MISSIQGNAGWLPANHAPQAASSEMAGERENDGDSDDAVRSVKTQVPQSIPAYMGTRIDTLA